MLAEPQRAHSQRPVIAAVAFSMRSRPRHCSHGGVTDYSVSAARFSLLADPLPLVGHRGEPAGLDMLLRRHNGLHIELVLDRPPRNRRDVGEEVSRTPLF